MIKDGKATISKKTWNVLAQLSRDRLSAICPSLATVHSDDLHNLCEWLLFQGDIATLIYAFSPLVQFTLLPLEKGHPDFDAKFTFCCKSEFLALCAQHDTAKLAPLLETLRDVGPRSARPLDQQRRATLERGIEALVSNLQNYTDSTALKRAIGYIISYLGSLSVRAKRHCLENIKGLPCEAELKSLFQ
jgi:hypothetical protein